MKTILAYKYQQSSDEEYLMGQSSIMRQGRCHCCNPVIMMRYGNYFNKSGWLNLIRMSHRLAAHWDLGLETTSVWEMPLLTRSGVRFPKTTMVASSVITNRVQWN